MNATPPMTREEEVDLIRRARNGDRVASQRILTSLVRLVRREAHRWCNSEHDLDDLVQEGLMGVLHAIDLFEEQRGYRFSTYAKNWWTQHIRRYARLLSAQGRGGASSVLVGEYSKLRLAYDKAMEAPDPVAKMCELTGKRKDVVVGFIELHEPTSDWSKFDNVLADPSGDPESAIAGHEHSNFVLDAVARLPLKEAQVLRWRYLDDDCTLYEIGARYGVTRQRAEQIESRAKRKLRKTLACKG